MAGTLIIKTGASGDVLRTTPLLHVLADPVDWITSAYNLDLVPASRVRRKQAIENIDPSFLRTEYELVINLEESVEAARLAGSFSTRQFKGVFVNKAGQLSYTPDTAAWFDMSLLSTLGKEKADSLKRTNCYSYQHYLFQMLGKEFRGEKYILDSRTATRQAPTRVGIERRVGKQWPNKGWTGYDELERILNEKGIATVRFQTRDSLLQYAEDISMCSVLVTGDTLSMHIALACAIPCVAIFNCTSPAEIYGYELLSKVISPVLMEHFYQTHADTGAMSAVHSEEVLQKLEKLLRNHSIKQS